MTIILNTKPFPLDLQFSHLLLAIQNSSLLHSSREEKQNRWWFQTPAIWNYFKFSLKVWNSGVQMHLELLFFWFFGFISLCNFIYNLHLLTVLILYMYTFTITNYLLVISNNSKTGHPRDRCLTCQGNMTSSIKQDTEWKEQNKNRLILKAGFNNFTLTVP